ncbi:formate dehydrogenase accessory sulfurtransferase FdhD [Planctomicrobium sp. SH668]|uniref:formate dehydrogenase accessory sulfurtransferase FdhD n=1 Tax=Planctomicrobium sp. SH668 TaxID=3448126 RepID=UPI003F5B86B1
MNSPSEILLADRRSLADVVIQRVTGGQLSTEPDLLAVEEPLEIRISFVKEGVRRQKSVSVTMRTPGADRELAAGFLFTEGIVQTYRDILAVQPCRQGNLVRVHLRETVQVDTKKLKRNFFMSSSCGICGKSSLNAVNVCLPPSEYEEFSPVSSDLVRELPNKLRKSQAIFDKTGGLHASAVFNTLGDLQSVREDVGRHNALDKLIGNAFLMQKVPMKDSILLISGRVSFELVQKAAAASIPMLISVGAPSSLAVELAKNRGMTLIGFVRDDRFNLYCGEHRIKL